MSDFLSALIGFAAGAVINPHKRKAADIYAAGRERTKIEKAVLPENENYIAELAKELTGMRLEEAVKTYELEEDMENIFDKVSGIERIGKERLYPHSYGILVTAPTNLGDLTACLVAAKRDGKYLSNCSAYWNMEYIPTGKEQDMLNRVGIFGVKEALVLSKVLRRIEEHIRQHGVKITFYLEGNMAYGDKDLQRYYSTGIGWHNFTANAYEGERRYYGRKLDDMLDEKEAAK